jgi:glycosyltransferase involved in cell wall biosynthesis
MSFYRALDVLLFNADWDAFPTTPLEAMGYAIPVVASALNSGLCEAITDPRYGVLLGTHDEPALADAVVALLRDPAAARRLGLTGRARVAELCEPETTVAAYERLLTGGPRSA